MERKWILSTQLFQNANFLPATQEKGNLSLEYVLEGLEAVESHVKSTQIDVPYKGEQESLERAKELFFKWLKIYRMYTKGYQQELGMSDKIRRFAVRMLSTFTTELESQVGNVFEAKIPSAAYLFVHDFFRPYKESPQHFVLSEYSDFKQTTFAELITEKLKGMTVPPLRNSTNINMAIDEIKSHDIQVIRYDRAQFDNVLSFPLLLHEAFHCLYEIVGLNGLEQDYPGIDWLREALIDIYVVNYFGPAYALSLATYLQKYPHGKTISHLSFISRIFIALQYLEKTQEERKLPPPIDQHVKDVREYLKSVWDQHKTEDPREVQEQVAKIYKDTEGRVKKLMSTYVSPFAEFLAENERKRLDAFEKGGFDFVENQTLSISDVTEYFQAGIPAAADPRVIFNSFVSRKSQNMIRDPKIRIFIIESLKKWHLKNAWSEARKRTS